MSIFELSKLGHPIKVLVRKSIKSRRISIKIKAKGVELVLPFLADEKKAYDFLQSKEAWIRQKLHKSTYLDDLPQDSIPIFGNFYKLVYTLGLKSHVHFSEDLIIVSAKESKRKSILDNFLKKKLLQEVTKIADSISAKNNLNYSEITIQNSKTKWGSCSSRKQLSFNWRLIYAPLDIVEYVVVHEMCHLLEMNHSPRFWAHVARLYPNYKQARLWLKANGQALHGLNF